MIKIIIICLILCVMYLIKKRKDNFVDNLQSLDSIFKEFSLDKSSDWHDYADYYDKTLSHLRNKKIRMIEIGIGTWEEGESSMKDHWNNKDDPIKKNYKPGNSLRAWKKYFYKLNYILGVDVKKDCMFEEPNIKTELLDSMKESSRTIIKQKYGDKFDVILDDGLHNVEAQVKTFLSFWPLLKQKGIYLIEDISDPNELKDELQKHTTNKIHIEKTNGMKISNDSSIIKIVK